MTSVQRVCDSECVFYVFEGKATDSRDWLSTRATDGGVNTPTRICVCVCE